MGKNNECFRIFEPVIFESKELLQVHEMLDKLLLETWRNAHIESFSLVLVFRIVLTTAEKLLFFFFFRCALEIMCPLLRLCLYSLESSSSKQAELGFSWLTFGKRTFVFAFSRSCSSLFLTETLLLSLSPNFLLFFLSLAPFLSIFSFFPV